MVWIAVAAVIGGIVAIERARSRSAQNAWRREAQRDPHDARPIHR